MCVLFSQDFRRDQSILAPGSMIYLQEAVSRRKEVGKGDVGIAREGAYERLPYYFVVK